MRTGSTQKTWIAQFAVIFFFSTAFVIHEAGSRGALGSAFLQHSVYTPLRRVTSFFTDLKFQWRGPKPPRKDIVIVEVDSQSISELGRWPWRRDLIAWLIERTFSLGARVVGLDLLLSEPEQPIPEELAAVLEKKGLGELVARAQTDPLLASIIRKYSDRMVLAWGSDSTCQPLFSKPEECDVLNPHAIATHPKDFARFGVHPRHTQGRVDPLRTPILSVASVIPNYDPFIEAASAQGFANVARDPDGLVRRASLITIANGIAHPSLPLAMASAALKKPVSVTYDDRNRVQQLRLGEAPIPVTPSGILQINFRGPEHTFTYVSARDILREEPHFRDEVNRKLAGIEKTKVLKDAIVFIGVTALALHDLAPTPFDNLMPGPEVQATVLDNLLSSDPIVTGAAERGAWYVLATILLLMTVGILAFAQAAQRLEAFPAIFLFVSLHFVIMLVDLQLFKSNRDWSTGFLYLEAVSVAILTIGGKYLLEEQKKKFLRVAFSKYVSPAIVDTLVGDPSQLQVGGKKENLTILFSDIRGFTSFSEAMDAKLLTEFLNEYFGLMTEVVFRHGGTLDKYIGDALMAFFGAPVAMPGHAKEAWQTAREMQQVLAQHRRRLKEKYGTEIHIGVGVNSGIVSVGNMGSDKSFGYTVIGDQVNLASRLVGASKKYGVGILTTHFTLGEIQAKGETPPPFRIVDIVKVKGKNDAVQLIEILDQELDPAGALLFEDARELYRKQDWDAAIVKFHEAASRLRPEGTDGPCRVFIERCEKLKLSPPEPGWDGSWVLEDK